MIITLFVSLITIAVIGGIFVVLSKMPKSSCTGDCNQGRNCTCRINK